MTEDVHIFIPTPDENGEYCLVCGNEIDACDCEPCPNCDCTEGPHAGIINCQHCGKEGCESCMANNMHFPCEAVATGGGYIGKRGKLAEP